MEKLNINEEPIDIAIVGGGIIGLILVAGLCRQGFQVKLYEQAKGFREIGAGIAFTANAIQCMELIDPAIARALRKGGSVSTSKDDKDPNDYLRFVDGFNQHESEDDTYEKMLYKIDAGYKGFEGTRRDMFLENLVQVIPDGVIELTRRLESISEAGRDEKMVLKFTDGSEVRADAVIGTDGIKSRVRQMLFGKDSPASYPHYTHKCAYRALVPMAQAEQALGIYKAHNQHMHVGPGAHLMHYPVANGAMINVTCFITDPNPWPTDKHTTQQGTRAEVEAAFDGWCKPVRDIIQQFPEKLEQWAVFDTWDYPAPFYNQGKICLAGDAAHASSPHHGAGACCGVEDALCLITVLGEVQKSLRSSSTVSKGAGIAAAFDVYDQVRRARSQWLVNSSRRVCDLYHQQDWGNREAWVKAETCFEEIKDRSLKIWKFDYKEMIERSVREYQRSVGEIEKEAVKQ